MTPQVSALFAWIGAVIALAAAGVAVGAHSRIRKILTVFMEGPPK